MHFYPVLANILRCTNCVPITSVSFGKYTSINAKTSGLAVLVQVWQFWHLYQPYICTYYLQKCSYTKIILLS